MPEYYPTRAEREILQAVAPQIAAASGAATLIELGSGSSEKTRLLIDALREAGTLRRYVPVDVSEQALLAAATALFSDYPGLEVSGVVSDFEEYVGLLGAGDDCGGDCRRCSAERPRLVAFLGSTIGNLLPAERASFLARIRSGLADGDALLLGTDLVKDPAVLVSAYDDAAGITAAFNKNVLSVLNHELGADFDPDAFEHVARWDRRAGMDRDAAARHQPADRPAARHRPHRRVRRGRGDADRGIGQVPPRGRGPELAAAGFAMGRWWTDGRAGSACPWLARPDRPLAVTFVTVTSSPSLLSPQRRRPVTSHQAT